MVLGVDGLWNPSRASRHHAKQSRFEGSDRQLRGIILKKLIHGPIEKQQLMEYCSDDRTVYLLKTLEKEELIHSEEESVELAN